MICSIYSLIWIICKNMLLILFSKYHTLFNYLYMCKKDLESKLYRLWNYIVSNSLTWLNG